MMHWELAHFSHFLAHFLADVLAHFLADVLAHFLADVLAHFLADVLARFLADVLAHFLADVLAHLLPLHLPANARHTYRSAALYHQILHNTDVDSYPNTRQV
jgi:hypothetical protein